MQGRLIQGLELNYVSRDTSQRSSPSGSGGWVSNVSFGGIQLNRLHMGTFSRNRVGVPLVCISGGPRASSQTRGRSHVASRCLVGPKATLAATPGLPGCPQVERATTAVWGPPSAERASPPSRHRTRRGWRGLTRSPPAETLWSRPQDLGLQALLGHSVGFLCRPGSSSLLWWGGITDSVDTSLRRPQETVKDREAWRVQSKHDLATEQPPRATAPR